MNTKLVDLTYLNESVGNDNTILVEMIDMFRNQLPDLSDSINAAMQENDWKTLGKAVHKAKSSVKIFGMENLGNQLEKVENAAGENEYHDYYHDVVDMFMKDTALALEELDEIVKTL